VKVYKIVSVAEDGTLRSAMANLLSNPELILSYSIEEWTHPECGYIFACKDEYTAKHEADRNHKYAENLEVWEAEARVSTKYVETIPFPARIHSLARLCLIWEKGVEKFFPKGDFFEFTRPMPQNTVLCKSLILIRRVA
jgi:hypothetical protein